MVERVSN